MNKPLHAAALGCAAIAFVLGLVWAYGTALLAIPFAALALWLRRLARERTSVANETLSTSDRFLDRATVAILVAAAVASLISLALTR
jgi:predicted metal-binding membrane protein